MKKEIQYTTAFIMHNMYAIIRNQNIHMLKC